MKKLVMSTIAAAGICVATAAPALASVNVGGGTWNYGSSHNVFSWSASVYSNYYHPTHHHSGTSVCGSVNHTVHANAGSWANSSAGCSYTDSTSAYWNNND